MLKNRSQIVAIFTVLTLLAVLIPQHQADAVVGCVISLNPIKNCAQEAGSFVLGLVGSAIGWTARGFDAFVQWQITSTVYNIPAVTNSWTIIRNFVNMFFILILIIMAFGTIFDIKKYTWQEMLVPFLISALLINFSLAIGQYIIDISNGLAGVFLRTMVPNPQSASLSVQLAQGFSQSKLITAVPGVDIAVATADGITSIAGNLIFGIIWLIIVLLAFLSAFIFTLARFFALWFLLIISPLAWLGYALPNLRSKTWGAWWDSFLCWCFFLPYYLFFLMFAVIFINRRGDYTTIGSGVILGSLTFNDLVVYGVSLVFLVGGLAMARKLACASGSGVSMAFGKIETGVRKYAPGAAYVRGAVQGVKERGAEIAEKGVFGIAGAQRGRLQEATAKGWIAGIPGIGQVPGAREARERVEMAEIEKDGKRIREQLLRLPADQQKAFLDAEKSKKGIIGQAAALEYVKQGYSDLKDYQNAVAKFGDENNAYMRQYLENIKQAKLSDLFQSPDQELQIARGQIPGTVELVGLRRELYKDLAKRNQISDVGVYTEAKQLLSPIPAELKSFLDSIKPEYIVGTREARQEAIKNRSLGDSDLERKLVDFMKDKKEINNAQLRQSSLDIVGGKETIEGRNIINEINKFNPIINIEADLREDRGIPTGPLSLEDSNRIVSEIGDKLSDKEFSELRKMSNQFWKDTRAQQAVNQTFEPEELAELLKGAPKEMQRALKNLPSQAQQKPTVRPADQPTATPPQQTSSLITPGSSYRTRSEEEQTAREQILKDLGKI